LPELKVISRCGVGLDNIDLDAASKAEIKVVNTPDAPTEAVAELAVCLMLDCLRRITLMNWELKKGSWDKRMGSLLQNKTVGIVGLGRIGKRVVRLLDGFDVNVVASEILPDMEFIKAHNIRLVCLDELMSVSDIVSLHIPYTKKNDKLINARNLKFMKNGAVFINTARGNVVDEMALVDMLRTGKISAGLDVFQMEPYSGPLLDLDNVVLTPHIGSYAIEAKHRIESDAVQNLVSELLGNEAIGL
jgi:D-3-phosphoglycerate dehydrogenase